MTTQSRNTVAIQSVEKDWIEYNEYDNHKLVIPITDHLSGLKGYVAVHSTVNGIALGGTRMKNYISEDAAISDVLRLSKAMSYKCALANLPYGGAKAVIINNGTLYKDRAERLEAYARAVQSLGGVFRTGTDVGISDNDVRLMARSTAYMLGVDKADRGDLTTSSIAARGVFYAIKATLRQLNGSSECRGSRIAIKGVGKLGGELARLIYEAGGVVLVSDIDPQVCIDLKKKLPKIQIIDNSTIHMQKVDIYSPCALGGEFNAITIKELRCRAITGGANNQLVDDEIGDLIHEIGILYAPDYIANAGGLIYVADELENDGFNQHRVLYRTQSIEDTLDEVYQQAQLLKISPHRIANEIALERMKAFKI
jgi:glutamate dehydrogenase/leucine dehydrogenase